MSIMYVLFMYPDSCLFLLKLCWIHAPRGKHVHQVCIGDGYRATSEVASLPAIYLEVRSV